MFNEYRIRRAFLILFFSTLINQVLAQSPSDFVKYSTIIETDGFVFLSEDKTLSEMRTEATAEAKRVALENCETYIKNISKVENFQIQYDLIESQSEGYVTILERKDHGITEDNRYHVWIKAEVAYRPKGNLLPSKTTNTNILSLLVWTDKEAYQVGDQMKIFIQCNEDCYVRVLHINADGQVLQLLPNPFRNEAKCKKGLTVQIPDVQDAFKLEIVTPFGKEEIVVLASSHQLGDIPLLKTDSGLYTTKAKIEAVVQKTRGIQIKSVQTSPAQAAEFIEVRRLISVKE